MKHTTHIIIALFIFTGIISFTGCDKGKIPGLVKCEGTLTWKGAPVEGAQVSFSPKSSETTRSAFGITDAAGKFKTTTLETDDGIMPGEYFVTVTKMTIARSGGALPMTESAPDAPREGRNAPGFVPEKTVVTYHIPPAYADRKTSGLSAVIPAAGDKGLRFELVGEVVNKPGR
jgi:hypothetical protein